MVVADDASAVSFFLDCANLELIHVPFLLGKGIYVVLTLLSVLLRCILVLPCCVSNFNALKLPF